MGKSNLPSGIAWDQYLTFDARIVYTEIMTVTELAASIGKPVYFVGPHDLLFACWVLDARISWGKPQFQIRPMAGTGTKWVEFSSIEPMPQPEKTLQSMSRCDNLVSR
jgi:hypothetical protein